MNKELEALEIIKSHEKKYSNKNICYYFTKEQYNIIKQSLEQKEQQEKELEELKDTITIYLDLETKIEKVGLTGLNNIEYSNYHKSYGRLKGLVGEEDDE